MRRWQLCLLDTAFVPTVFRLILKQKRAVHDVPHGSPRDALQELAAGIRGLSRPHQGGRGGERRWLWVVGIKGGGTTAPVRYQSSCVLQRQKPRVIRHFR